MLLFSNEKDNKSTFQEIQPLCINIAKKLDLSSVQSLDNYLESFLKKEKELTNEPISALNEYKEYIAFPLILILKKENFKSKGTDLLLETALTCLGKILSVSLFIDWNFFKDIFSILFIRITSPENVQIVGNVIEEIKIEVLQNVVYLCKALPSEHWDKVCSDAFRAQLGHAVYICLQIAEKEKNQSLKISALQAIEELGLKYHWNNLDTDVNNQLSYAFTHFLPGIAMSTTRIATAGEIQGHKVTVEALQCWEYFVTLVMRDRFLSSIVANLGQAESLVGLQKKLFPTDKKGKNDINFAKEKIDRLKNKGSSEEDHESGPKLKKIAINSDWVSSTSERVTLLANSIFPLVSHSHWRVRETLVYWTQAVFQHCARSLPECTLPCLETLITLKSDPVKEVYEAAEGGIALFRHRFDRDEDDDDDDDDDDDGGRGGGGGRLAEMLEERVFALATRMPALIRTRDDVQLLSSVRQLLGSLEVVGERMSALVQIPSHLGRLLNAFVLLFTFDYSDSDLLLEKMMSEDTFEVMAIKRHLGRCFRYFRSESILTCASLCCGLVGRRGELTLVVDRCLDLVQESALCRSEALLMLNLIVEGAINQNILLSAEEKEKVVDSIIDVLLNLGVFEFPLSVSERDGRSHLKCGQKEKEEDSSVVSFRSFKPSVSVDLAKRNVLAVSNAVRLIGTCALLVQKDFNVFLSRILCSVMEKAGESNLLVSHSALLALENMATACEYKSVSQLIEKSVCFFWFSLSQKLKRLPEFPSSPQVLRIVLKCHQGEVKTFVQELVEDVLDSLDAFHTESSLPLLTVLSSFVDALNNTREASESDEPAGNSSGSQEKQSLCSFLEELHEKEEESERKFKEEARLAEEENDDLSAAEGFAKYHEEKENEKDEDEQFQEEKKEEIPKHIDLVVRILERCSYLLFVKERKSQLVILEIIKSCCYVLHDWEDQRLPSFHLIWKPLVLRLKDKDFVVLLKALETCVLMVKSSGDFLRRRFLQELFPHLAFFLESQSSASLGKTRVSGYHLTPAFKAQKHILENIPSLLRDLKLDVMEAKDLLKVILLYVDNRQPPLLNQLAFSALEKLSDYHPDLVWLAIAYSKEPFRITPPSPLLLPVTIKGSKKEHLNSNVLELYEKLC